MKRHRIFLSALLLPLLLAGAGAQSTPASPLGFKLGDMQVTPGGFIDFTLFYRSTTVGSGIGTNFAAIPANNSLAGRLNEFGESAQNSRLTLKASSASGDLYAYLETDFLGNAPSNVTVSSNSDTLRLRVFFVDYRHGAWEVMAGQDWSLLTPSKTGLSPMPSDVAYGATVDTNYHVGLTWARQPQIRLLYHASPNFTLGLSFENGQPYAGGSSGAPKVTLPGGDSGPYAKQVNTGSSGFGASDPTPDIIAKVAYDSAPAGHGWHLEVAGLESQFRVFNPALNRTQHAAGAGVEADAAYSFGGGLRLFATSFFGDGGGRYFYGMAPDLIIRQNGAPSPVLSQGGMLGAEVPVDPADKLYAYYGGLTIHPNFDLSGATPVGYGYPGASTGQNRSVQEATLGLNHTFWKSARHGSLQLMTQASYLVRTPFTAADGAHAHTVMGFVNLRYTLP